MLLSIIFSLILLQTRILCSKNEVKKSDKFSLTTLEDLTSKHKRGIIEFNTDLLKKFSLIDHQKRDFNLFILFNALDRETNCEFCGIVAESFAKFVDLFSRKAKTGRFPSFFATIELKNNIEAFQMMGLDHVPIIMHFGPDARAPKKFENNDPNDHSQLLRFFATQSGAEINVENSMKPEPRYSLPIVLVSVTIVLAGLILTGKLPVSMILQNSFIWSVATMSFIIVMLSGYMWVKIRSPPFVGSNQKHETLYIVNSLQNQLGIESRIVTGLNAAIVIVFLLISPITYKSDDKNKRRVAAMVISLLYMAGHAGLLKAFVHKFPGYPLSYIF